MYVGRMHGCGFHRGDLGMISVSSGNGNSRCKGPEAGGASHVEGTRRPRGLGVRELRSKSLRDSDRFCGF